MLMNVYANIFLLLIFVASATAYLYILNRKIKLLENQNKELEKTKEQQSGELDKVASLNLSLLENNASKKDEHLEDLMKQIENSQNKRQEIKEERESLPTIDLIEDDSLIPMAEEISNRKIENKKQIISSLYKDQEDQDFFKNNFFEYYSMDQLTNKINELQIIEKQAIFYKNQALQQLQETYSSTHNALLKRLTNSEGDVAIDVDKLLCQQQNSVKKIVKTTNNNICNYNGDICESAVGDNPSISINKSIYSSNYNYSSNKSYSYSYTSNKTYNNTINKNKMLSANANVTSNINSNNTEGNNMLTML